MDRYRCFWQLFDFLSRTIEPAWLWFSQSPGQSLFLRYELEKRPRSVFPLPLVGSSCPTFLKHLKCRFKAIQGDFGRGASLTNKKHFRVQCIDILVIISFLSCVGIQQRVMHRIHSWCYSLNPQNFGVVLIVGCPFSSCRPLLNHRCAPSNHAPSETPGILCRYFAGHEYDCRSKENNLVILHGHVPRGLLDQNARFPWSSERNHFDFVGKRVVLL